jgi:hypothetical protein
VSDTMKTQLFLYFVYYGLFVLARWLLLSFTEMTPGEAELRAFIFVALSALAGIQVRQ